MDSFLTATIGEYRITGFIGEGGMGRVYRATHTRLNRTVAVKILVAAANDSVFLQRFLNEAQIQSQLRDPGIAALYDFTEYRGNPVIIMEYVDGYTIQQITETQGVWPADRALPVLISCARVLEYVHSQGIVHRDLKSANVKVSSTGQAKLLDFGIATGSAMQRMTVAGFVIGTFQSLSPEQTRGEAATTASDIWAFGVLMYEMLTASLPFEGSNAAELFSKIGRAQFTPPTVLKPGVPKALEQIVGRCLRRNPEDRYHSMRELREDLERAAHGPRTMPEFIPASGRPLWQMALAVLAVLILLVIGYVVLRPGPKRPDTGTDANGVDVVQPGSQSGGTSNGATSGSLAPGPSGGDDMTAAGLTEEKLRTVRIDTFEGSAEVWQNGVKVGDTPFDFHEKYGTTVTGILKRPGFQDKSFQFEVGDRRSYEFALDRIGEQ